MSRTNQPTARYPRPSWVTRALTSIGAALALIVSFFLGALVFLTALGLLVVLAVGVAIRIWWLRRQFRRQFGEDDEPPGGGGDKIIEGDYVVVTRRRRRGEPSDRDASGDKRRE